MGRRFLFDTTRIAWRARRGSPTGIDRVVMAYAAWLLARKDIELAPVALAGNRLTQVSPARLKDMLRDAEADIVGGDRGTVDELLDALTAPAGAASAVRRPVEAHSVADWIPLGVDIAGRLLTQRLRAAPQGDIYINVAHTGLHRPGLLSGLVRRGIAPVVMVHDLIPITHPEFCTPGAGPRHARRIDQVLDNAALIIANSNCTALELERYAARTNRRPPPIEVAQLGLAEVFRQPATQPSGETPYFIFVGTIEARKNLAFLLTVWRRIAETMGDKAPHLVLVGRRGWENEAVIDHLERSPTVRNLVHEVADLTDAQLAKLVSGSRALLAPSLVEGFDLPPIEALALGTPVIASDIDVHRELAQGATLVDPLDGPGWVAAIIMACERGSPPAHHRAATWADHFHRVGRRIDSMLDHRHRPHG